MRPKIAVLTPALPDRCPDLLVRCLSSVARQEPLRGHEDKPAVDRHVVAIDYQRIGVVENTNQLAAACPDAEWFCPLADDDELFPHYMRTLQSYLHLGDVVYGWPTTDDAAVDAIVQRPFSAKTLLESQNNVMSTALIRADLWRAIGGYRHTRIPEDWQFWLDAIQHEARFVCVPEVLWLFRKHEHNLYSFA